MQTFLPYSDFEKCADMLDKKRCFKQAVEAKQILCTLRAPNLPYYWRNTLSYIKQTWKNHPSVKMWEGYEEKLKEYYNTMLRYSIEKHKVNTQMEYLDVNESNLKAPWWLGDKKFHSAMRARILEKQDVNTEENTQYLWPDMDKKSFYEIHK